MCDFLLSSELWSNIIGGIVASLVLAGIYWIVSYNKRKTIKGLIDIEGKSIQHRNNGEAGIYENKDVWAEEASIIHDQAIVVAKTISPAAGALIDWLGTVDPYVPGNKLSFWISMLDKVNERIRIILEKHI